MTDDNGAEVAGIVAGVTAYIYGLDQSVRPIFARAYEAALAEIDAIYERQAPVIGRAMMHADVNLPGDA